MILIQSDLGLFFGRFHSLVVHLPIGFLLLGSIFFLLSKKEAWCFLKKALPLTFLLATLGAILAASMGWFLAKEGAYSEATLFWHRSLGIATALLSGLLHLHFSGRFWQQGRLTNWGILTGVLLLSITGHLGGQLTHGPAYLLDYAPPIVKQVLGGKQADNQLLTFPMNPDSVFLYEHLIQPIFDKKCIDCHNPIQARGGLNLTSSEGLLVGGDNGNVLEAKPQQGSQLLHRVTLESNDPKYMPTKGIPLNYAEIRLLEYWVNHGHSFEQTITDEAIPLAIRQLIKSNYGLSNKRKSYVEVNQVPAADPQLIEALVADGFTITKLSQTSNFLEVIYRDSMDCGLLQKLTPIKEQITWLNLSRAGIKSDCLEQVQGFLNLTRLQLSQNPIDNDGLFFLKDLLHLESLNLYNTSINEKGLSHLESLDQLQHLYLGQTKIDSSAREMVTRRFPSVTIVLDD